ncbi:hypothetical protein [Marinomonas fungiae]|uniref:hypothetical protein n=1 Tax=Marinomonas fungiae TaxID=1137284 RepID=UPI003A947A1B
MAVTSLETPAQMAAVGLVGGNITGVFGSGKSEIFFKNGVFKAPKKGRYRVRLWGGGTRVSYQNSSIGYLIGGHGGFAMKTVELEKDEVIEVTVGNYASNGTAGTSSFGNFVSATGGTNTTYTSVVMPGAGGTGIGGDVNITGQLGHSNSSNSSRSVKTLSDAFSYAYLPLTEYFFTEVPTLDHIGTQGQFPSGNGSQGLVIVEY